MPSRLVALGLAKLPQPGGPEVLGRPNPVPPAGTLVGYDGEAGPRPYVTRRASPSTPGAAANGSRYCAETAVEALGFGISCCLHDFCTRFGSREFGVSPGPADIARIALLGFAPLKRNPVRRLGFCKCQIPGRRRRIMCNFDMRSGHVLSRAGHLLGSIGAGFLDALRARALSSRNISLRLLRCSPAAATDAQHHRKRSERDRMPNLVHAIRPRSGARSRGAQWRWCRGEIEGAGGKTLNRHGTDLAATSVGCAPPTHFSVRSHAYDVPPLRRRARHRQGSSNRSRGARTGPLRSEVDSFGFQNRAGDPMLLRVSDA